MFLVLLEGLSFSIIKLYSLGLEKKNNIKKDTKYEYINAEDLLYKEKNYAAFYGWRGFYSNTNKFEVRETLINKNWNKKNYIYFFGGSTVLGSGTTFDKTISSHFTNLNHTFQTVNVGEHGYVSGQSLNRFIEMINEINENDIVVFYEGVNDVIYNCNINTGLNGHARVYEINQLLKNKNKILKNSYNNFLVVLKKTNSFDLFNAIFKRLFSYDLKYEHLSKNYICGDKDKAIEVSRNLERHWLAAEVLAHSRRAKFFVFLQPSPYTASFKVNVPIRKVWKRSYDDVYPIIRDMIKEKENFHDLSKSFRKDYYLDWCCHLNSEGNKAIASKIYSKIIP